MINIVMSDKTLISLTKNDPSIFVTIPISEDDCVGSSLPFINFNFKSIDNALSNIEFSANNYWNAASEYIIDNQTRWDDLIQEYESGSIEFVQLLSTVENLSADWFTPISLMYPTPLSTTGISIGTLSTWLITNYPVNPYSLTDPYCFDYMEGQELYLFTTILSGSPDVRVKQFSALEFVVNGELWVFNGTLSGY